MEPFCRLVQRSFLLATASVFFAGTAFAGTVFGPDVLTVGQGPTCITGTAGQTVTVPVFIRDVSGTLLGVERPAAEKIQAVSFQVTPSNPGAIAVNGASQLQITFSRAGVTAGVTPVIEATTNTATTSAYLVSYNETTSPIPFTSNMAAPGDLFVNMNVQLAVGAASGTTINLTLNPAAAQTQFSNFAGTISETTVNGNLALVSGCIVIAASIPVTTSVTCPAAFSAGNTADGAVTISAAQGTPTTITLSSSDMGVATIPANVVIPAGSTSAPFTVTGVSGGTSTITATPPAGLGTAQTCTATVNGVVNPAVPALGPFGLFLVAATLMATGFYAVTKTMS